MLFFRISLLLLLLQPLVAVAQESVPTVTTEDILPNQEKESEGIKTTPSKRIHLIGFGADVLNGKQNYGVQIATNRPPGGPEENVNHIIQLPQFSFIYQTQLLRSAPRFFGELQVRYFRRNEDRSSDFLFDLGPPDTYGVVPTELAEQVNISNLYLYPGINYYLGNNREIIPYIGAGVAIAKPLSSERSVTFKSDNYPEYPKQQTTTGIQATSYGYFAQLGLQMNFPVGIGIGFVLRQESLEQLWSYEPRSEVINSRSFITNDNLTVKNQFMFQGQINYSW